MNAEYVIPIETIIQMLDSEDRFCRCAAMRACFGRDDVPIAIIEKGLCDPNVGVKNAAIWLCATNQLNISEELLEKWKNSESPGLQYAAVSMHMYIGKDRREFEPPELVYKKCLNNVIVVASIPKDACVRGGFNRKCRANKAHIVDIIGDLYGEKVGISLYDLRTKYFIGDDVIIEDFDWGTSECSTGFHFFCDINQARKYNMN